MGGAHTDYLQGEGSSRERWKTNYFRGVFYSLQYSDPRCHVPTNKREKAAKKLRCTVRQRSRQLGCLQDLCSHARCQRHSNHLSILDLSLRGYIGLILRAGIFHHVAYEICRHLRHDSAAHTETGKGTG